MKTPKRFNADYETELFHEITAPPVINQSLEFLYLYLEDAPLYSTKKYPDEFLKHVEEISGHRPEIVNNGKFENWWGPLNDLDHERRINSKELSSRFIPEAILARNPGELEILPGRKYLAKPLSEMSGRGFCVFDDGNKSELNELFKKSGTLLIEPFLDRKYDFSHYILPGRDLAYENIVDSRFQYKGTTFRDLSNPFIESLSFYHDVLKEEWNQFSKVVDQIKTFYARENVNGMYSIDSFVYLEDGILKVRAITEVNVRKTMGYVAWKLSEKYAKASGWSQFLLAKSKAKKSFRTIKEKAESVGALYLSPGDTRFEIFFVFDEDEEKGRNKVQKLKRLLPDTEFPV